MNSKGLQHLSNRTVHFLGVRTIRLNLLKRAPYLLVTDTLIFINKVCLGFASIMGRGNIYGIELVMC